MRIAFIVVGALALLMGGVWFLQGVGVLPGSYMTGQSQWAIYGGALAAAGIALLAVAYRRHR